MTAHWQDAGAEAEVTGHLITDLSLKAQQQVDTLELSKTEDTRPMGARLNTALRALAAGGILRAEQLLLAKGRWLSFPSLPAALRTQQWQAADYLALCQAMDSNMGDAVRSAIQAESEVTQSTLAEAVVATPHAQIPESVQEKIVC